MRQIGISVGLFTLAMLVWPGPSFAQISIGPLDLESVSQSDVLCLIDPVNCAAPPLQNPPICTTSQDMVDAQGDPGVIQSAAWQIGANEFLYLYQIECHTGPNYDVIVLPVPVDGSGVLVQDVNGDGDGDETLSVTDLTGFMPYNQDPGGLLALCQTDIFSVAAGDFTTSADFTASNEILFANDEGIFFSGNLFGFKTCRGPQTVQVSPLGTPSEFGILAGENPTVPLGPVDLCVPTPGGCHDHFKCYQVVAKGKTPKLSASLVDQFESADERIMQPVLICNPVDKNGEGILDPENHLTCYEIVPRNFSPKLDIVVENQFGEQALTVVGPRTLCVPSVKQIIEEPE